MGIPTCLIGAQEVTPNLLTSTFLGEKKKGHNLYSKGGCPSKIFSWKMFPGLTGKPPENS